MLNYHDNRGVTGLTIILFGLLTLAVVLLNGIAMTAQGKAHQRAQEQKVAGYCSQTHEKLPPECRITEVFRCGERYILRSNCLGVGDVIVGREGQLVTWCGYSSLNAPSQDCRPYLSDKKGRDCTKTNNLCAKK